MLVLDFDGTLAPIVRDPSLARPHPRALAPLRRLLELLGTVGVLTGRPAGVAAGLLGASTDPALSRLVVLGSYGLERWSLRAGVVGDVDDQSLAAVAVVRSELPSMLERIGAPPGVLIEDKGIALAVHVRRAPDPAAAMSLLHVPLAELATAHGLRLEPGRLVLELRPPGIDKGIALEKLALERNAGMVVYAGDDLGDVAAFDAVDQLRARGIPGLLICSGSAEVSELVERADIVVDGPAGIADLLTEIAAAVSA
jgi:trehalose 6-phosphate phosphatase